MRALRVQIVTGRFAGAYGTAVLDANDEWAVSPDIFPGFWMRYGSREIVPVDSTKNDIEVERHGS